MMKIFSDNLTLFDNMLRDISKAKRYIYLESYRFNNDEIGNRFRHALVNKVKEGVNVKILLDSWGSNANKGYFSSLINHGGEVRFFRKLKFNIKYLSHNHNRDHRKLLVIDDEITYIGSTNICKEVINWRELNLRVKGNLSLLFRKAFLDNFEIYKVNIYNHKKHSRVLKSEKYEIIRDVPSIRRQKVKKKNISLIKSAKKSVYVDTPYFLPDRKLRKAFRNAVKRGIDVRIILPLHSDVKFMDIIRARYLGALFKNGVKIFFYKPLVSHSKVILIDEKKFVIGSPNMDYRSYIQQFEIIIVGENSDVAKNILKYFNDGFKDSVVYSHKKWKARHFFHKFLEKIVSPFRKYF